jgi:cytochrome c oxidase assembly protein subunit 15
LTAARGEPVSPWPYRLALATALAAVPLVLFGGSVTTLGAGMAVEGWLVAEGHFLVFFPIESWFRDTATFVEHSHRLFGVLVGLFCIATVAATFRCDRRRRARFLALGALAAVCAQGTVGGFRVLENSPDLAFLHGALAQAVFALLLCTATYLAPRWIERARSREPRAYPADVRRLATLATVAIYVQIVLGAWYRHALRPEAQPEATPRFLAHALGALVVLGAIAALAAALARLGTPAAQRDRTRLVRLIGAQMLLGVLALVGYREGAVGPLEWTLAILHVLGGGLLLYQAAAIRMQAARAGHETLGNGGKLEPETAGRQVS